MKSIKTLAIGALALAAAAAAHAQTFIHIVGSNGDRPATQTAISNILASGWTYRGVGVNAATSAISSAITGSSYGAWNGTWSGNPVIIKVSFAGALAGIDAVASNPHKPYRFVFNNGTGSGTVKDPYSDATAVLGTDYENATADFGFSTNFQSTSPYNGVFAGTTYNTVIEEIVGVSPLGFYASPGFPTGSANITTQIAQQLYTSGSVPLALFTGDFVNDGNKIVYAIGRNTDAGQRFGAFTEIGLGTSTNVKQWQPTYGTATGQTQTTTSGITYGGVVTSQQLWPAEVVSGISSPTGSGGYQTGALLAPQLTATLGSDAYKEAYTTIDEDTGLPVTQYVYPNATAGYYIGYLTPGDALTRVLGQSGTLSDPSLAAYRGVALSYNGVPLHNAVNGTTATVNTANIQNGKYTAWVYNRLIRPNGGIPAGVVSNFADALRDRILNFDAVTSGGIKNDSNFKVKRTTDGGLVIAK